MRAFALIAAAVLCAAPIASADITTTRYASHDVGIDDLNLDTDRGVERLSVRIRSRMWALCGTPHEATMTYVSTGGGKKERAACKANLRVDPSALEPVRRAFAMALETFD